jgi:5-formyltetrahydrofolate cyclo-ligase
MTLDPHSRSSSRQSIRRDYRHKRNLLAAEQQVSAARKVLDTCLDSIPLHQSQTVACYLSNDGELDPQYIIQYCWKRKKRVLLPVLHPFSAGHLIFVEYLPNSQMRLNRYGIKEPIITSQNICPLANINLLLTPLVAFDAKGNRLGMGGGYYDRTLTPIRRDGLNTQLIGLAHQWQQIDSLAANSWDIPLDGIVTPDQFFAIE